MGNRSDLPLMMCYVIVESAEELRMEARAILDSGSSASFVSERLSQCLHLPIPVSTPESPITRVAGFIRNSTHPITTFHVSSVHNPSKRFPVTAVIVSHVTSDLPLQHICTDQEWNHISNIQLANPDFRQPGKIDLVLVGWLRGKKWGLSYISDKSAKFFLVVYLII